MLWRIEPAQLSPGIFCGSFPDAARDLQSLLCLILSSSRVQATEGVESQTVIKNPDKEKQSKGRDEREMGYKTFLGHLYDLLEEKINTERYDEGVRQLVGNQVCPP